MGECAIYEADSQVFSSLSSQERSEGIMAVVHFPDEKWEQEARNRWQEGPGIVLDGIQDPGNLGTIIRTADWFGIPWVICLGGTVDVYNPKVLRSSMGSVFRVHVINWVGSRAEWANLGERLWIASLGW